MSGCQADLSGALKVQFNGEDVARWMESVVQLAKILRYSLAIDAKLANLRKLGGAVGVNL